MRNTLLQGRWDQEIMRTMVSKETRDLYSVLKKGREWQEMPLDNSHLLKNLLVNRNPNIHCSKKKECDVDSANPAEVLKATKTDQQEGEGRRSIGRTPDLTTTLINPVEDTEITKATHTPKDTHTTRGNLDAIDQRNDSTVESIPTNPPRHHPGPRKKN